MNDVIANNFISLNSTGVLALAIYNLVTSFYSLLHDTLDANLSLFTNVKLKLVEQKIIERRDVLGLQNPLDLLTLLPSKTPDQCEKFFIILTANRVSSKNLRFQIAQGIVTLLERSFQGFEISTIDGHHKEFSELIRDSLTEWCLSQQDPTNQLRKYCNLKVSFTTSEEPPVAFDRRPDIPCIVQIEEVNGERSEEAEANEAESGNSQTSFLSGIQTESENQKSSCWKSKKMKCAIISVSSAVVVVLTVAGIAVGAVHLASSETPGVEGTSQDTPTESESESSQGPTVTDCESPVANNVPSTSSPKPKPNPKSRTPRRNESKSNGTTATTPFRTLNNDTASRPVNYTEVFIPPQGTILSPSENDLSDTHFYTKELCSTAITFRTLNTTFDSPNFQKINFSDVPCSSNVTGLEISGSISVRNVRNYLKKFPGIQYLSITGSEICDSLDESFDRLDETAASSAAQDFRSKPEKLLLKSLSYIKLTNSPECKGIYRFFNEYTEIPNVSTFDLDQIFISSQNEEDVSKFLGQGKAIRNLNFQPSNVCPDCVVFSRENEKLPDPWRSLEVLRFNIPHHVGFQGFLNLKQLLSPSLPNLKHFESNVEIPSKGYTKLIRHLVDVRFMNATFNMAANVTSFSASFFSNFPLLEEAHVDLKFNDSSLCRRNSSVPVALTNLERNVGRSKLTKLVMSSNCDVKPVKGWRIPCFDYETIKDFDARVQTVWLTRDVKCSNSKDRGRKMKERV